METPNTMSQFFLARRTVVAPSTSVPAPATPALWASIVAPAVAQSANITQWAQKAQQDAEKAAVAVKTIGLVTSEVNERLATSLGAAEDAKAAAEHAEKSERRLRAIRDGLARRAQAAANSVVPEIVKQLQIEALANATQAAKSIAAKTAAAWKKDGSVAAARAAAPFQAKINNVTATAQGLLTNGDQLAQQAASLYQQAQLSLAAANQVITGGGNSTNVSQAVAQSRSLMRQAAALNRNATASYAASKFYMESVPVWQQMAANAATHVSALVDPASWPTP
jgi:hypothetical protein